MRIIQIKQLIILVLLGFFILNLYTTYGIWDSRPRLNEIRISTGQLLITNQPTNITLSDTEAVNEDFDYKVIGYRASTGERSSVILKKNNKEYVVQEGDLLDNRYKLKSVGKDKITFTASGRVFEIENRVGQ